MDIYLINIILVIWLVLIFNFTECSWVPACQKIGNNRSSYQNIKSEKENSRRTKNLISNDELINSKRMYKEITNSKSSSNINAKENNVNKTMKEKETFDNKNKLFLEQSYINILRPKILTRIV